MASKKALGLALKLDCENSTALTEGSSFNSLHTDEKAIGRMVEESLNSLGENLGRVILYHLETKYRLDRSQIAENPELFVKMLRDMFGTGAPTIEKMVTRTIRQRMNLAIGERETSNFSELVRRIRERLLQDASVI